MTAVSERLPSGHVRSLTVEFGLTEWRLFGPRGTVSLIHTDVLEAPGWSCMVLPLGDWEGIFLNEWKVMRCKRAFERGDDLWAAIEDIYNDELGERR